MMHSTSPTDDIRSTRVSVYENPETSEVAAEFDTLAQAVSRHPANPDAEIIRNGQVRARARRHCWVLTDTGLKAF